MLPVAHHDGGADGQPAVAAAQRVELVFGEAGSGSVVPPGRLGKVAVGGEQFGGDLALPVGEGRIIGQNREFGVREVGVACLHV